MLTAFPSSSTPALCLTSHLKSLVPPCVQAFFYKKDGSLLATTSAAYVSSPQVVMMAYSLIFK